jgi:hypothetical protein
MAIERRGDAQPLTHRREHPLDDALVDRLARLADVVLGAEARGARMEAEQPLLGQWVRREMQERVRRVDRRVRFGRQVNAHPDPRADDGQRAGRHRAVSPGRWVAEPREW